MLCPYCKHKTDVTNSRHKRASNQVWRRRRCPHCSALFTSEEQIKLDTCWMVRYKNDSLAPFDDRRLFINIYECCKHRADAISAAENLHTTVVAKLMNKIIVPEIEREEIVNTVFETLQKFDTAAAVQYAAYHSAHKV